MIIGRREGTVPERLEALEAAYDGPVPAELLAAVLVADAEGWRRLDGLRRLHAMAVAESRLGVARRRRGLPAVAAIGDHWLARLTATLASHRAAAARVDQRLAALRCAGPRSAPGSGDG